MKVDINKALEQIAEGLNVAVEKVYPILYKQAIIDGIFSCLRLGLYLTLTLIYFVWVSKFIKKMKGDFKNYQEDENNYRYNSAKNWISYMAEEDTPNMTVGIIVTVIFAIFSIFVIVDVPHLIRGILTAFFNTDYYIIESVIKRFK